MAKLLSADEIAQLTGAEMPYKQCQVLQENGVLFVKRKDGRPALTWEAVNTVIAPANNATPKSEGFNLEAID